MFEFIILGMLLHENLTGYDLKKRIENGIGIFYRASFGSLYPCLRMLLKKRFVLVTEIPDGKRMKKYYTLTELGRSAFFDWLIQPMDLNSNGTSTHLAKVYFFDKLEQKERDQQLLEFELNNVNYLRKLKLLEKEFIAMYDKDDDYYKLSTLYYGICIIEQTIKWCHHIRLKKPLIKLLPNQK